MHLIYIAFLLFSCWFFLHAEDTFGFEISKLMYDVIVVRDLCKKIMLEDHFNRFLLKHLLTEMQELDTIVLDKQCLNCDLIVRVQRLTHRLSLLLVQHYQPVLI